MIHIATPAPKIFKEHTHIDFNKTVEEVYNKIRGLSPFPTAWASLEGEKVNIYEAKIGATANIDIGEILYKRSKTFSWLQGWNA